MVRIAVALLALAAVLAATLTPTLVLGQMPDEGKPIYRVDTFSNNGLLYRQEIYTDASSGDIRYRLLDSALKVVEDRLANEDEQAIYQDYAESILKEEARNRLTGKDLAAMDSTRTSLQDYLANWSLLDVSEREEAFGEMLRTLAAQQQIIADMLYLQYSR